MNAEVGLIESQSSAPIDTFTAPEQSSEQAPQTPAAVSNGNAFATSSNQGQQQRLGTVDSEISPQLNSELENDADGHAKYVKRQTSVQRTLRRVFPSLFAQSSLPVTTK